MKKQHKKYIRKVLTLCHVFNGGDIDAKTFNNKLSLLLKTGTQIGYVQ